MAYEIAKKQPPARSPDLEWDERGPGLYDGETLVQLGRHYAAVSVETEWLANGAGVVIKGSARWCDANGATRICPQGQHVEIETRHTVDPLSVKRHGLHALKREMLLLVLGEEAELMAKATQEDGTVVDAPVLGLNEIHRLNVSIRHAMDCVNKVAAPTDARALLTAKR